MSGCFGRTEADLLVALFQPGGCFGLVHFSELHTLETSQHAAVKSSERRQTIALWTLNVSPRQVIVRSEPFPDSRRLLSVSFGPRFI